VSDFLKSVKLSATVGLLSIKTPNLPLCSADAAVLFCVRATKEVVCPVEFFTRAGQWFQIN